MAQHRVPSRPDLEHLARGSCETSLSMATQTTYARAVHALVAALDVEPLAAMPDDVRRGRDRLVTSGACPAIVARMLSVVRSLTDDLRAAGLALVADVAGLELDGEIFAPADPEPPPAPVTKPVVVGGDNYYGAVLEYSVKHGVARPGDEFEREGPPHAPTFRCRMTWLGQKATASAKSHAEAKRLCAEELFLAAVESDARDG